MTRLLFISLVIVSIAVSCAKPGSIYRYAPVTRVPVADTFAVIDTVPIAGLSVVKTYLALGDSYTFGPFVTANERFPVQLSIKLRSLGMPVNQPEIIASSDWTTGNLLNKLIYEPPLLQQYNFVTLLIGVNNQYRGRPIQEYATEFSELLDMAIKYTGNQPGKVFVLSIPDWSVTPFANGSNRDLIAAQIDLFNFTNRKISEEKNVHYVDITEISRMAATDPGLISSDRLHPSGKQYSIWVEKLAAYIRAAFY